MAKKRYILDKTCTALPELVEEFYEEGGERCVRERSSAQLARLGYLKEITVQEDEHAS